MRTLKVLAFAATAIMLTAPAAVAQQSAAQPSASTVLTEQQAGEKLSNSYIGASVVARSAEGLESVGKVSELLLNDEDKIVGVVVDVGGFLGIGAKPVGLSWAALDEEQADGSVLLRTSLTREELEAAPAFKTAAEKQLEMDRQMMEQSDPAAPASDPATVPQPTQ